MGELIKVIGKFGILPGVLLFFLFLIIQDPNRAYKLKSLLIRPFFKLFRWFKRSYISNEIAAHVNTFLSKELTDTNINIKVKWVRKVDDPILTSGSLIVRMKQEDDQTKNILTATRYALPKVILPVFRHHISDSYANAIDFTFLHKLADKLGNNGRSIFRKHFLNPEITLDSQLSKTFQKLIRLDRFGIFTTIFINELEYVGKGLYADFDHTDRTNELIEFINYLCTIAERELGEEIELEHFSEIFNVSTILLAKSIVANKKGLIPYLRRLNINLQKGAESIYIIAFPPVFKLLDNFLSVVDGNQRVSLHKVYRTKELNVQNLKTSLNIACLRRNKLFTSDSFISKLEASHIEVGKIIDGIVIDCSTDESLISFLGVDGTIKKSECSWLSFENCTDVLSIGVSKKFIIKEIDKSSGQIKLSLKTPINDPWTKTTIPKINDLIEIKVRTLDNINFKCTYNDLIEVTLPISEVSWYGLSDFEIKDFVGKNVLAKVTTLNEDERIIYCSLRKIEENPWGKIHSSLAVGTEFNGKIQEVSEHFVRVSIGNGLVGKIPKEYLLKAGHEYARFTENLVIGQGLDVIVSKVHIGKKWIRLDLKRNQ